MIKVAPAPEKAAQVKLATANINLALVILVINTPARAPVIPVALVPPVAANTLNVIAHHLILGHQGLVLAHQLTNTPAPAPVTPAVQALLATANTPPVPAPAATNGKMEAASNKFSMAPTVSCITAMTRWLASVLQV